MMQCRAKGRIAQKEDPILPSAAHSCLFTSMPAHTLTTAQRRIAHVVAAGEAKNVPVFITDLVRALGLAGESSVTPTIRMMKQRGFLEIHGGGKQRAYRVLHLTRQGREAIGAGGLPIVGRIAAGLLHEALAQPEEFLDSGMVLPHQTGDFLLRVTGDSMVGDGIVDGDLVLLRPNEDVRWGEIAAAYVGDAFEATLKHVYVEKSVVRLKASNPAYPELAIPQSEWRGVAGVYRGLIRHVRD
jgi:repressor LexA